MVLSTEETSNLESRIKRTEFRIKPSKICIKLENGHTGEYRDNTFTFKPTGNRGRLSMNIQDIQLRAVPTINHGRWHLSIHLSGKGILQENTTALNPLNARDRRRIEQQTEAYLASLITKGFKQSQCVGSDVYMTYEVFERSYPHECQRARAHWATVYPNIHLSVHPQIQLMHSGASNS
ncbi:Ger(x)C family spore germination C-terminal domain-containing protein [Sporolactobacillus terrae]|uniref:Ger(x)C family spore germination C-terminal domain-containing protein n=1 Tax=Sporolactobacillus terrae TaxID=269673 RepID=UPI00048AA840|nr:Ger(x)C family spore germination C-terminal domain-containing protein [Sporolactobacillus terrae]